jgi:hypothetical protein
MLNLYSIFETLKSTELIEEQYVIDDVFVKIHIEDICLPVVYTFSNASDITRTSDLGDSSL